MIKWYHKLSFDRLCVWIEFSSYEDSKSTWDGLSISSRSKQQIWMLNQVGNRDIGKLDLKGDGDFTDASEYNDNLTHDKANELTARDTDHSGTNNYTLTYDALGHLTDDGENYEYVYGVFGRLRKVKNTTTQEVGCWLCFGVGRAQHSLRG